MVNMRRDESVELKVWINDAVFADGWHVYTAVEGEHVYAVLRDPGSDTTLKIRITRHADAAPEVTDKSADAAS